MQASAAPQPVVPAPTPASAAATGSVPIATPQAATPNLPDGPVAPRSGDAEFVRRIYLDLAGRIPTAAETRAWCAGKGLEPRDDETNADPAIRRNLIRPNRSELPGDDGYKLVLFAIDDGTVVDELQRYKLLIAKLTAYVSYVASAEFRSAHPDVDFGDGQTRVEHTLALVFDETVHRLAEERGGGMDVLVDLLVLRRVLQADPCQPGLSSAD